MNLIEAGKMLQTLGDQQLQEQMQNPAPGMPQYLVMSEMQRRKETRDAQQTKPAPNSTVADDLMHSGLGAMPQAPQGMPAPQGAPVGMAAGGIVHFDGGGDVYSAWQNANADATAGDYTPGIDEWKANLGNAPRPDYLALAQKYGPFVAKKMMAAMNPGAAIGSALADTSVGQAVGKAATGLGGYAVNAMKDFYTPPATPAEQAQARLAAQAAAPNQQDQQMMAGTAPSAPISQPTQAIAPPPMPAGAPMAASTTPQYTVPNNPTNIKFDAKNPWQGQVGQQRGFATFKTPEDGMRAAMMNLAAYGSKHGINTVSGAIDRWAPASDNTAPGLIKHDAYIASVSKYMGLKPDDKIDLSDPAVQRKMAEAITAVEQGTGGSGTPSEMASSGSSSGSSAMTRTPMLPPPDKPVLRDHLPIDSFQDQVNAALPNTGLDAALERNTQRLADSKKDSGNNINMAMIRAGLAMMAGKSNSAMQNIGTGGIAGFDDYTKRADGSDKEQAALQDRTDLLDQAKQAAKVGNFKMAAELQNQANRGLDALNTNDTNQYRDDVNYVRYTNNSNTQADRYTNNAAQANAKQDSSLARTQAQEEGKNQRALLQSRTQQLIASGRDNASVLKSMQAEYKAASQLDPNPKPFDEWASLHYPTINVTALGGAPLSSGAPKTQSAKDYFKVK